METSKSATSTRHASYARRAAKKPEQEIWLEENREAIEAYNELVAKEGVFSDGLRGF
jgi:post-segregation antitoxin (ccd killing protein)